MYKITIEETKMVRKMVGKEWVILTEKDSEKMRGYSPEIEKEVEKKEVVYTQIVEGLNLFDVIEAVNGVVR